MPKLVPLAALAFSFSAAAQPYPSQPVRLIAPFPPGGSVDIMARLIAEPLAAQLGGKIVIDNRSGASGNIGMEAAARAKPDGHSLVLNTIPLATNQALFDKLTRDPIKDFAPIGMVATAAHVLVVPQKLKANSIDELVALGARQPRKALLRLGGRRHHVPPVRRDVQGLDQDLHPACALPRRRAGARRHAGRPGRHELPDDLGGGAAYQRPAPCARSRSPT